MISKFTHERLEVYLHGDKKKSAGKISEIYQASTPRFVHFVVSNAWDSSCVKGNRCGFMLGIGVKI